MAECEVRTLNSPNVSLVVELGRRFVEESPTYGKLRYNPQKMRKWAERHTGDSSMESGWIATHKGRVVGFLFASAYQHPALDGLLAMDDVLYVAPEFRGTGAAEMLVEKYKAWAKSHSIIVTFLASTSGVNTKITEAFYKKCNFEPIGVTAELLRGE